MKVRAKFNCSSVETVDQGQGKKIYTAKFSPVYSDDPGSENKKFWEYTPCGSLELGTIKLMPFEVGKEYYLDIIEADKKSK